MSVARNLTRFFEIVIRFQRNRPDIPYQETDVVRNPGRVSSATDIGVPAVWRIGSVV
jgi:hypothetical protein